MLEIVFELLEIVLEIAFEGIIPATIPTYSDNRKNRIIKAFVAILVFLMLIFWASLTIAINSDYRAILACIFLIVSFSLTIILIYLRAKGIKFSILYSLNFILILIVFGMGLTESIILITTSNANVVGTVMLISTIFISLSAGVYTALKIRKYTIEDKKVLEIINNHEYDDKEINALNDYKLAITDGHLAYYNKVTGNLDELKLIKKEIPSIMFDTTKNAFKHISKGDSETVIKKYDSFIKIYKNNLDRYLYRMVYTKYNYIISNKLNLKRLHSKIKDNIYPKNGDLKTRLVVRGIVKLDDKYALLKIEDNDEFGERNHFETPGGGVENLETYESAIKRELLEEIGCEVEIDSILGYIDIEYNLLNRLDRCIFISCIAVNQKETSWSKNEKRLIKGIYWYTKEEIEEIYLKDVENVGKMIHERDYAAFKYYFKKNR